MSLQEVLCYDGGPKSSVAIPIISWCSREATILEVSHGVHNRWVHTPVALQMPLQSVAVCLSLVTATTCSLYLPPGPTVSPLDLDGLIAQLPRPFIILGEFNAPYLMWGCDSWTPHGLNGELCMNSHNVVVLNRMCYPPH